MGTVTRQCPQTTIFEEKRKQSRSGLNQGPSADQPSALPPGHTGSQWCLYLFIVCSRNLPPQQVLSTGRGMVIINNRMDRKKNKAREREKEKPVERKVERGIIIERGGAENETSLQLLKQSVSSTDTCKTQRRNQL